MLCSGLCALVRDVTLDRGKQMNSDLTARAADANRVVVASFTIANIAGEMARRPGGDGFDFV
jgi:hypothetical protein